MFDWNTAEYHIYKRRGPYLSLYCIGCQKDRRFRWTIDITIYNGLLDLQKEKMLCDFLYELLRDIFWEELGKEQKRQRTFFWDILIKYLKYIHCS
jgi:hypothetical protein